MRTLLPLAFLSLVGFTSAALSARTHPNPAAQSAQQNQQERKSVQGTVVSIGDKGRSFALETNDGGTKQTLQFVVDQETQVQGQVKVGTPVKVEYVAMADQNVAKTITPTQG
jgi:ribosomal protein S1